MSDFFGTSGADGGGVDTLNGLEGDVLLVAGDNVTITPVGNTLVIESSDAGTPGGNNTEIQFNDAGAFGGDPGLTYNKTTGDFLVNTKVGDAFILNDSGSILGLFAGGGFTVNTNASGGDAQFAIGGIINLAAVGGVAVPTRTGTPATMAAFTSAGVLTETTIRQPIAWAMVG